jgi:hypothetical protein
MSVLARVALRLRRNPRYVACACFAPANHICSASWQEALTASETDGGSLAGASSRAARFRRFIRRPQQNTTNFTNRVRRKSE